MTSTLKLKQPPPRFSYIPNLLIHYKAHMSIKKMKETCREILLKTFVIRRSQKIFEQEKISNQFLYSCESFN